MGCSFVNISSSSYDEIKVVYTPSPEPKNWDIVKQEQIGPNLVVKINYKDVDNYEGDKILVYKNCDMDKLITQKLIDPHFSNNDKMISPIARFEPTEMGWNWAIEFTNTILK